MLDSLLSDAADSTKRFTVYAEEERTDVEAQFSAHDVDVDHQPLPGGRPEPFMVVEEDGEFAGAIALEDLEGLLEPPVVRPGPADEVSDGYRVLFEVLDNTMFRAMTRRELLAVAREIEERAFRIGTGTLQVSFQRLSAFEAQTDLYRLLASETDLDVHVYGREDWTPPTIAGITYHEDPEGALEAYWALAFVGGDHERHTSALVAREETDGYDGFWTDDPDLTRRVMAELTQA